LSYLLVGLELLVQACGEKEHESISHCEAEGGMRVKGVR
jgi:hypothetical protein